MSIEDKVKKVICNHFQKDVVGGKTSFKSLGADSLDVMEMVMSLEDEFDINIPEKDIEFVPTVDDLISYIKVKVTQEAERKIIDGRA